MAYQISRELGIRGDPVEPGKVTFSNGTDTVTLQASDSMSATYDFTLPTALGAVGDSLVMTSATATGWTTLTADIELWVISDVKTTGTDGAIPVQDVWNVRELNTITSSAVAGIDVQLAVAPAGANEILIQPGSYYFYVESLGYQLGSFKSALWNETAATYAILGVSLETTSNNRTSTIQGPATFASQTVLSIRTYPTMVVGTSRLALATGIAPFDEIYTKVYIRKL